MSSKNDGPDKDAGRAGDGGAGGKRPHATIDVKAIEIKSEPVKSDAAAKAEGAKPADAAKTADAGKPAGTTSATWTTKMDAGKPSDPKAVDAKAADAKADASKAAASATTAASAPRKSGIGGFFTHLAAGVVGGFLALLGADTIGQKVLPELGLPAPNAAVTEATAAMQKRLAALEAAGKTGTVDASSELAKKLAAAEQRLAALDASLKQDQSKLAADTKALADKIASGSGQDATARVTKLEERLASLVAAAGAEPGKSVPQLAAVTGKIADLEQTVSNQLSAVRKGVAEQIEARVNSVAEAAEVAKSGTARLDKDMSALKTETVRLKADSDRLGQTLRTMQEESAALRSSVDGLRGDLDSRIKSTAKPADVSAAVNPVASKLTALENSVASVVKNEDNRRANAERILLSLELGNMKRAIDRGAPFAAELADVKRASAGKIDLSALDRFKDKGVAPQAELMREFRSVANAVLDADAEPSSGGVFDRLMAGAKSVVRVRKISAGADDTSAEATLARMESALKEGRLGEVLAQSAKLPAKAAVPAHDWLVKVEARNTVDRAIASVETSLKAALAGPDAAPAPAPAAPAPAQSAPAQPAPAPEKK